MINIKQARLNTINSKFPNVLFAIDCLITERSEKGHSSARICIVADAARLVHNYLVEEGWSCFLYESDEQQKKVLVVCW